MSVPSQLRAVSWFNRTMPPATSAPRNVLRLVQELHLRGFQRLRISPGMSPSGAHWRCLITSAANISRKNGAMVASACDASVAAHYSSADLNYFGWADAKHAAPDRLARLFIERFPDVAASGRGRDWAYAGWYLEMMNLTYPSGLPIAYADYPLPEDALATTNNGADVVVPFPPPGEANGP